MSIMILVMKPYLFPETRDSLLAILRGEGADSGWRVFFELYAPAVLHVARFRGLTHHDAEDIVQLVMLELSKKIIGFRYDTDRGRFRNWVRTIAERKIIDFRRKKKPELIGDKELTACADDERSVNNAWDTEWRLMDIEYCLNRLAEEVSARHMQVFRMYTLEGFSAKQVSERLGCPTSYVYVVSGRLLKRLKSHLDSLENSESQTAPDKHRTSS